MANRTGAMGLSSRMALWVTAAIAILLLSLGARALVGQNPPASGDALPPIVSFDGKGVAFSGVKARNGTWRGLSAGHGGIRAAMGFDAGRDAGVAGQRPAPPSALEPESSRAEKERVVGSTARQAATRQRSTPTPF